MCSAKPAGQLGKRRSTRVIYSQTFAAGNAFSLSLHVWLSFSLSLSLSLTPLSLSLSPSLSPLHLGSGASRTPACQKCGAPGERRHMTPLSCGVTPDMSIDSTYRVMGHCWGQVRGRLPCGVGHLPCTGTTFTYYSWAASTDSQTCRFGRKSPASDKAKGGRRGLLH